STVMYYTGLDPRDLKPVYVCRNPHEKAMQRALIQYRNPKNYDLVYEALTQAGRTDLIGYDKKCLIRPRQGEGHRNESKGGTTRDYGKARRNASDKSAMRISGNATQKRGGTSRENGKKKTIRNIHKKKGG
ncbi:MAG: DUF3362 domain-containing protein, partial [Acetatifactor sp.]|nr:DUF3362 domain-containing protein [Acetatifactor sp.]